MKVAHTLSEWPLPMLRLDCPKCGRSGQYQTHKLIDRFGPDFQMPDLRLVLTGCTRTSFSDYCGVRFTDALAVNKARDLK